MPIQQTDERLFKGTTAEILAFSPPAFTGWTYAESTTDHSAYRWNSTTLTWEPMASGSGSPPTSPEFFVSNAGSDAPAQPGTLAMPLLTVQEAARRLGVSGWLVQAFITLVNTINLGANPVVAIPEPQGSALPICIRTTYVNDLTGVTVTAAF